MWKAVPLVLAAVAGCAGAGAGAPTPRTELLSNAAPSARGSGSLFDLGAESLGPILPTTPATEEALQELLGARYTVTSVDRAGQELHVFLGAELLFYVIPDDNETLFNIHVVSPKIALAEHPEWVIASPFRAPEPLTACECWGQHPVCFRTGDHVGVAFEIGCDGLDTPEDRRAHLVGVPIQRAVWNPHSFGAPSSPGRSSSPPPLSKIFGGDPP